MFHKVELSTVEIFMVRLVFGHVPFLSAEALSLSLSLDTVSRDSLLSNKLPSIHHNYPEGANHTEFERLGTNTVQTRRSGQ